MQYHEGKQLRPPQNLIATHVFSCMMIAPPLLSQLEETQDCAAVVLIWGSCRVLYKTHAGRHPGAIVAASSMLGQWHLLTHEDQYLDDIGVQLQRCERDSTSTLRSRGNMCSPNVSCMFFTGPYCALQGGTAPRNQIEAIYRCSRLRV